MYRDMPMEERMNRIGELLAKGVYLYLKKEKEAKVAKEQAKKEPNRLPDMPSPVADKNQ
ncbi:MAG: hypothetical protein KGJ95_05640 [Candidatus Omnitrophica bacterium]|nr:hypothetical protein [Candidatus Omnitrophota bacterium]